MVQIPEKTEVVDTQPEESEKEANLERQQQVVVASQPKKTKRMTLRGGGLREWRKDLCHCSGTCCCALCFSPCILQKNRKRYRKILYRDHDIETETFCNFWGCWCCCQSILEGTRFQFLLPCINRRDVRHKFSIDGSDCGDCCKSYFCLCFTLSQEAYELKAQLGYISDEEPYSDLDYDSDDSDYSTKKY